MTLGANAYSLYLLIIFEEAVQCEFKDEIFNTFQYNYSVLEPAVTESQILSNKCFLDLIGTFSSSVLACPSIRLLDT